MWILRKAPRHSFTLDKRKYEWQLEVNDDWVDTELFAKFDALLRAGSSGKRFSFLDLGGQDCLIGCCNTGELVTLKERTGLEFKWMVD